MGGMVLATSKKTLDKELPPGAYFLAPPPPSVGGKKADWIHIPGRHRENKSATAAYSAPFFALLSIFAAGRGYEVGMSWNYSTNEDPTREARRVATCNQLLNQKP